MPLSSCREVVLSGGTVWFRAACAKHDQSRLHEGLRHSKLNCTSKRRSGGKSYEQRGSSKRPSTRRVAADTSKPSIGAPHAKRRQNGRDGTDHKALRGNR